MIGVPERTNGLSILLGLEFSARHAQFVTAWDQQKEDLLKLDKDGVLERLASQYQRLRPQHGAYNAEFARNNLPSTWAKLHPDQASTPVN